jgi:hypothetical protein
MKLPARRKRIIAVVLAALLVLAVLAAVRPID